MRDQIWGVQNGRGFVTNSNGSSSRAVCVFLVQTYPGGRAMDEFVYACPDHGAVAVITRREIAVSQPPAACPWCSGPLRVDVRHAS